MMTTNTPRALDELAGLGQEVFDRAVRPTLRPEDDGRFVAVDVDSGEYEIDADDYTAVTRLKSRFGYDDSLDVFGVHGVGSMLGMLMLGFLANVTVND